MVATRQSRLEPAPDAPLILLVQVAVLLGQSPFLKRNLAAGEDRKVCDWADKRRHGASDKPDSEKRQQAAGVHRVARYCIWSIGDEAGGTMPGAGSDLLSTEVQEGPDAHADASCDRAEADRPKPSRQYPTVSRCAIDNDSTEPREGQHRRWRKDGSGWVSGAESVIVLHHMGPSVRKSLSINVTGFKENRLRREALRATTQKLAYLTLSGRHPIVETQLNN
jgi:hypothetical protein